MTNKDKFELHDELKITLEENNYKKICQFLHTNHFESDSDWVILRCNDSFIQGFREAQKIFKAHPEYLESGNE